MSRILNHHWPVPNYIIERDLIRQKVENTQKLLYEFVINISIQLENECKTALTIIILPLEPVLLYKLYTMCLTIIDSNWNWVVFFSKTKPYLINPGNRCTLIKVFWIHCVQNLYKPASQTPNALPY